MWNIANKKSDWIQRIIIQNSYTIILSLVPKLKRNVWWRSSKRP
jgi:hypothetical protein